MPAAHKRNDTADRGAAACSACGAADADKYIKGPCGTLHPACLGCLRECQEQLATKAGMKLSSTTGLMPTLCKKSHVESISVKLKLPGALTTGPLSSPKMPWYRTLESPVH